MHVFSMYLVYRTQPVTNQVLDMLDKRKRYLKHMRALNNTTFTPEPRPPKSPRIVRYERQRAMMQKLEKQNLERNRRSIDRLYCMKTNTPYRYYDEESSVSARSSRRDQRPRSTRTKDQSFRMFLEDGMTILDEEDRRKSTRGVDKTVTVKPPHTSPSDRSRRGNLHKEKAVESESDSFRAEYPKPEKEFPMQEEESSNHPEEEEEEEDAAPKETKTGFEVLLTKNAEALINDD